MKTTFIITLPIILLSVVTPVIFGLATKPEAPPVQQETYTPLVQVEPAQPTQTKVAFNWLEFWNSVENPVSALLKAILVYFSGVLGFNLLLFMPIISNVLNWMRKQKVAIESGEKTQEQAFDAVTGAVIATYPSKVPNIIKRFGSVAGFVELVYRIFFKKK